ncbi:MAG: pyridoxamine 5'-phosphate oxidase family protein [Chitinophagaceae bacterium]
MIGSLSYKEAKEVLATSILGRIGCNDGNRTYVIPVNYVFDGKNILGHSVVGMKIHMMRSNPNVCFQVDEVKSMNDWKSIIVWGRYEELTDERERYAAMKLFVDKLMRMKISETAKPPELSGERLHPRSPGNIRPIFYRIVIDELTGRYEKE